MEDFDKTLEVLKNSNFNVSSISDVYVLDKKDKLVTGKPGFFGQICQKLKDNNVSIKFGYPAEHNRFIFGVNGINKANMILK